MTIVDAESIGRRVAEARARAQLTQTDLARAAGMDRTALAKIEIGARRITALELAQIAEQTGETFEWFVKESPAAVNSYRAASGACTTSSIDRLLEQASRDVELVQSLGLLVFDKLEPSDQLHGLTQALNLAETARDLMGLPAQGPIVNLVEAAASIGLLVFSKDLGVDAPDAATTLLAHGGVSVINSERAVGRRRLALAHELGHYLLADEYSVDWRVGGWGDAQLTERLLDTFARAVLLPAESLSEQWVVHVNNDSVRQAAVRIASQYRVDMATLATRLEELDIADIDALSVIRNTRTTRGDIIEHDLVVALDLEGTTVSGRYAKAVLALYRSERISVDRAIDLLHGTLDETGLPPLPPVSEKEIWKFTS